MPWRGESHIEWDPATNSAWESCARLGGGGVPSGGGSEIRQVKGREGLATGRRHGVRDGMCTGADMWKEKGDGETTVNSYQI